jgi:hypothetical protein
MRIKELIVTGQDIYKENKFGKVILACRTQGHPQGEMQYEINSCWIYMYVENGDIFLKILVLPL